MVSCPQVEGFSVSGMPVHASDPADQVGGNRPGAPNLFIPHPPSSRRNLLKLPSARASVSRFQILFYAFTEDYHVDANQSLRTRSTTKRVAERSPVFRLPSVLFERGSDATGPMLWLLPHSHTITNAVTILVGGRCNDSGCCKLILLGMHAEFVSRSPPTFLEYNDVLDRVDASVPDLVNYRQHVPIQASSPPLGGTKNDQ